MAFSYFVHRWTFLDLSLQNRIFMGWQQCQPNPIQVQEILEKQALKLHGHLVVALLLSVTRPVYISGVSPVLNHLHIPHAD